MKYTPKNPNEHKFKPSRSKLKGFNKKQPHKKKNKVDVTIKTNKMSIMDILFSGQRLPQLQGLMRQSYFDSLCYQCQPKFYGFEYTTYKFDIKWPKQRAYEFAMLEASVKSRSLKFGLQELLDYNIRDVELTERFSTTSRYPNLFTGTGYRGAHVALDSPVSTFSGFDSEIYRGIRLTYEPYSEYEEMDVRYILGSTVSVMDDWLLAEDIVPIKMDTLSWTRYRIKETYRRMMYLLMKTAIENGVNIDKWKHAVDVVNKRKNMMIFE